MPNTKTTWEDLANLGWPIHDVFNKANANRGDTMHGDDDLSLNDGIAARYQWWSYNTLIGDPWIAGRKPNTTVLTETAWSYDNSDNDAPYQDSWTEAWTNKTSASVTLASSVSITLSDQITIPDVGGSGLSITFSLSGSSTQTQDESYQLSHSWTLTVGPFEKLSLIRVKTIQSELVDYVQEYGLANGSMVGTEGDRYNDHYYWGMDLNGLLGNPNGQLNLQGNSTLVTFSFKIVREGPKGSVSTKVPIDFSVVSPNVSAGVLRKWGEMETAAVGGAAQTQITVPGVGEK